MYTELLIGCGNRRNRDLPNSLHDDWQNLTTLDIDPSCQPDHVFDLSALHHNIRLPFDDNSFDEIHAYEVLEHLGKLGDFIGFFKEFAEYYRVLKPDGLFCATVPLWSADTAFGDPGHTRIINNLTVTYLVKREYERQIGITSMTDYRKYLGTTNFELAYDSTADPSIPKEGNRSWAFVLRALK